MLDLAGVSTHRSREGNVDMKPFAAILPLIFLHSCELLEGNPTLARPSKAHVSGWYGVSKTSILAPHKQEIGAISIELKNSGIFRLSDPGGALRLRAGLKNGRDRLSERSGA